MQNIEEKIKNFLAKYSLLYTKRVFLLGFSGGIDSLCLLDILNKLSKEHGFQIIACHLNHNWRKEEAKQEQLFAEDFCKNSNIAFYTETLPDNLPQTELEAREQRYKFFERCFDKFEADGLFTGHTLTDKTETIFYRIIKGTGLNGLKSIPEKRLQKDGSPIYRPMLDITREETTEYCKANNLTPNEDSSNLNEKYIRNRIRLSIFPELKKINPNLDKVLNQLSMIAQDSENLVEEYISEIKKTIITEEQINTQKFALLSIPAQKKILLDFLIENELDYSYDKIEEILNFIQESCILKSGNTLSLTTDKWLFVSKNIIKIIFSIKSCVLKSQVEVNLDGETFSCSLGKTLVMKKWTESKPTAFPKEDEFKAFVDLSQIKEPMTLRTRESGDIIQPFGMTQKTKIKKYLINKGVPEFLRDEMPVLAIENEILWAAGAGISELIRVKDIPTHVIEII